MQDTTNEISVGPILMNRFGERYLPAINQEAFSRVGAENLFRQQFGDLFTRENSLYLIVGCDSGLLVRWIAARKRPEGSRFLFIEIPQVLELLRAEKLLPASLPAEVVVTTPDNWMVEAERFSMKDYFYLDQIFVPRSLAVLDGVHDGYARLWNDVERDLGQYRIVMGNEIGNRVFMLKGLENLAENRFPACELNGSFQGQSAILLAGGPTLAESFPWIRAHRENIAVIAVARVAESLQREGIVPDLIFAIDPHEVIFHQSKGMLAFWRDAVLINMYHLNPTLLGQWRGRSAFMGTLFPWESPCNPGNASYPGITVSHQALGMAVDMGFSTIVLAGFDLCFSREGFTHAAGSVEQSVGPFIARGDLRVETNGGWMAETRPDFLSAIPSLAALARFAAERHCRVVNPSSGSARIEGVDHLPWEELVPQPPECSAREQLLKYIPEETATSRIDHYQSIERELVSVRGLVAKVKELAIEGIECNDGLFGRRGKKANFKYKKRMDEIEKILDGDYREVSRLVKKWGIGAMLRLSRPDKERDWSDEEIEKTGRLYYEIYRDNAVSLIKQLDAVRQRVRARGEEERNRPDFKQMIKQWREDGQPGRALVFLDRRGWGIEQLPDPLRNPFKQLSGEYDALIAKTDHDYRKHVLAVLNSPQEVRAKAQDLFRNREIERLRRFAVGWEQSTLAEKIEYGHLLHGYLAELDGDLDGAMSAFRQVTHEALLTDALRQMFSIALRQEDMVTALAVSQRLSDLSFQHVPFHAELLRIRGQVEVAAAIFEEYLKVVRNDFVSMVKLGRIYLELGQKERARTTFERIVAEDPENQAVRSLLAELDSHGVEQPE
ncbi:MAG: DUF115 domain-containing protein [Magnetococcus sp. YQC-9]